MDSQNKDTVNVCLAADNGYAPHLAMTVSSMLSNTESENINIYIFDGGISIENKNKILNLSKIRPCNISFVCINNEIFEKAPLPKGFYFTQAIYYRLLTASILPHVDKIIYLDSDVSVKGDIAELYNMDVADHPYGAVKDYLSDDWLQRLKIEDNKTYYYSGVLLINCKLLREQNYEAKFFDCIEKRASELLMPDQDVINIVCGDKILPLQTKWNSHKSKVPDSIDCRSNVKKVDTAILHFAGRCKPWLYSGHYTYKNEYYKYLNKTEFATFKTKYLQWLINLVSGIICIYNDNGRMRYRVLMIKGRI